MRMVNSRMVVQYLDVRVPRENNGDSLWSNLHLIFPHGPQFCHLAVLNKREVSLGTLSLIWNFVARAMSGEKRAALSCWLVAGLELAGAGAGAGVDHCLS